MPVRELQKIQRRADELFAPLPRRERRVYASGGFAASAALAFLAWFPSFLVTPAEWQAVSLVVGVVFLVIAVAGAAYWWKGRDDVKEREADLQVRSRHLLEDIADLLTDPRTTKEPPAEAGS